MFDNKSSGNSTNSFLVMVKSLVQQQYIQMHGSGAILPIFQKALGSRSQTHASGKELSDLFLQLVKACRGPVFVMIDALDEAEEPIQISTWLRNLTVNADPSSMIKVFVTSRQLADFEELSKDHARVLMEPALVDQDIDRYIPACLKRISDRYPTIDTSKLGLIHGALQKGHNGLFLWARLLTEYLLSLPSPFDVIGSLNHLPDTLTGLYRQILASLCMKLANNRHRQRIAERTISWLCYSRTLVTLEALGEALAIAPSDTEFLEEKIPTELGNLLREVLGAFVEILPHSTGDFLVQFVHLSVKDFFLQGRSPPDSKQDSSLEQFFPDPEQANAEIASTLFRYLSFSRRTSLQQDLSFRIHDNLLPYASTWCCTHLRVSGNYGLDLLPLVRSLSMSDNGVVWLDNARKVREDDGAHFVVLNAELRSWRQSFAIEDQWLDNVVPRILRLALAQCEPDSIQFFKRAYQLTQVLELIGERKEATEILEKCHPALDHSPDSADPGFEVVVWSLNFQLGRLWGLEGRQVDALKLFDKILQRSTYPDPGVRRIRNRLQEQYALVERGMGELNKSELAYETVCKTWADLAGPEGVPTNRALGKLASVFDMQGRLEEAEELQSRVAATTEKQLGRSHPLYLVSAHDLGSVYEYRGKLAEAESIYQYCMVERKKMHGDSDVRALSTMHNFALVLEAQGRVKEAKAMCEDVLELRIRALGDIHGDVGRAYNSMASMHLQTGNYGEAATCANKALAIKRHALNAMSTTDEHVSAMVTSNLLAGIHYEKGEVDAAWEILDKLLADLSRALPSMTAVDRVAEHPSLLTAFNNSGIVKASMGLYGDAEDFFQKAYDGRCRSLGPNHILTVRSLGNLAWASVKVGKGSRISLGDAKHRYSKARTLAASLASSQLGHQFGTECLDKALFVHSEYCVSRMLGQEHDAMQLRQTLEGLLSILVTRGERCFDGVQAKRILEKLKTSEDLVLDRRWERLRDIR